MLLSNNEDAGIITEDWRKVFTYIKAGKVYVNG